MPPVITARPIVLSAARSFARSWIGPRERLSVQARVAWLGVAVVCGAVLTMAALLRPDARGHGTHEALGLPPCSFVLTSGLPCPTCGMTTSFAELMHGHPLRSMVAQPAGAVLCVLTVLVMVVGLRAAIRGYLVALNWDRIGPVRFMLGFGLLLLGGWGFKIAHGLATGILPYR